MAKKDKEVELEVVETAEADAPTAEELAIRAAFDDNQGKDEEVVKMAMLQAGCKIKAVTRIYNQFMVDSGLMASKEEKDTALGEHLTDLDLTDEDAFNEAVTAIEDAVTGATEASAATMIRSWAKTNEVECYKKPAGERRSGFRFQFYAALKANPSMTEAQAKTFGDDNGSENDKKAFSHYQTIRQLINDVANPADEAEAEVA